MAISSDRRRRRAAELAAIAEFAVDYPRPPASPPRATDDEPLGSLLLRLVDRQSAAANVEVLSAVPTVPGG
jgi:hypothetical protein